MKKSEFRSLIREEIQSVLKEIGTVYGEKEAGEEIFNNPKIEAALKKIRGYESIASGKPGTMYVYFKNEASAKQGAELLDKLVPGPNYMDNVVNDEGMWVIEIES
jgi:arginyl-tRNA synthetase